MNKKYCTINDLKDEFYSFLLFSSPKRYIEEKRRTIRSLGYKTDIVFDWANHKNAEECKKTIKLLRESGVMIKNPIDDDKIYLNIRICTEYRYLPNESLSRLIVKVVKKAMATRVLNYQCFHRLGNNSSAWDLYVRSKDYEFDPHLRNIFCYRFLNDKRYINTKYALSAGTIPFKTKKRFDGFLAHLFYAGYKDLYEEMFDILLETIERNVDATMPLIYFLYTFCKVNDKEKCKKVLEVYKKIKSNNKNYNWNHEIKDFYFSTYIDKNNKYNDMPIEELLNK